MSITYYNDADTTDYGFSIIELPSNSSKWNLQGETSHTRVFKVTQESSMAKLGYRADTIAVGRYMRQLGFKLGTSYSNSNVNTADQTTLLSDMSIDQSGSTDNPGVFTVTCTYGRVTNAAIDATDILNIVFPLEWGYSDIEVPLYSDYAGAAIVNKAGDPISPPVMATVTRDVLTFQRNESTFDHNYAKTFRNTVNAAAWNGYAAKMVLCKNITAQQLPHPQTPYTWYYHVTYVFEFHDGITADDAASVRVLNAGWNQLDGTTGAKKKILDPLGNDPMEIPLLDISGAVLTSGDPILLSFQNLATSDFSALNITL